MNLGLVQLEEACVKLLQNLHGLNEDGSKPIFTVQVMLHSSEKFGPSNVRELTVRIHTCITDAAPVRTQQRLCLHKVLKVRMCLTYVHPLSACLSTLKLHSRICMLCIFQQDCMNMQSNHVAQLVMIPGIITAASKPKHVANTVTVMCRDCRLETTVTATAGSGGITLPRKCSLSAGPGGTGGSCNTMDPWQVLTDKSTFADQQSLKIQVRNALLEH